MNASLPAPLQALAGRIVDINSHEMLPLQLWEQEIGPCMRDLADVFASSGITVHQEYNHPNVPGFVADDQPIEPDAVWKRKGSHAPGAADIRRRTNVMEVMGVKRQLMFPTAGTHGLTLMYANAESGYFSDLTHNRVGYGKACAEAYNVWATKVAGFSDRVRPVAPVFGSTPDALIGMARDLIEKGIRAVMLPTGVLPGGVSPAHPDLDPFWRLLSDSNVAGCLHVNVDTNIYGSEAWSDAPAFQGFRILGEFKSDPWSTANFHIAAQNFLTTTVLGGVFERHPGLRFGVIELGAAWVGPQCDLLDMWYSHGFGSPKGKNWNPKATNYRLPEPPSYYIRRNVRVSAFFFEKIDRYISQYDLGDVLCFASDYPHVEGGLDPVGAFYERLAPLGQAQVEKFFVSNGSWLLPD